MRIHLGQQDFQALVRAIPLGRDLLARRHHSFGLAELDDHRAIVGPLDDTAEDFAFLILVFLVDGLALEVADAGVDHLLDCLGGDATEVLRRPHDLDRITDDRRRRVLLRLFDRDLQVGVLDDLGDRLDDDDLHLAGRLIQLDPNILFRVRVLLVNRGQRLLDRAEYRFPGNTPFRRYLGDRGVKITLHPAHLLLCMMSWQWK